MKKKKKTKKLDGCDVTIAARKATKDEELPPATGGVEEVDNDGELDGCDVNFHAMDAMLDEELPAAVGGVG